MEITDLLKQMKKADEPRLKELAKPKHPKARASTLTDKQKFIRGLLKGGMRK